MLAVPWASTRIGGATRVVVVIGEVKGELLAEKAGTTEGGRMRRLR